MVHKPMSIAFGNANEMQKTIDALNKIEESVMMPMYMTKSKVDEETIQALINDETWFSAKEMDKYFDVILVDEEKKAVASVSSSLFKGYKNVPEYLKNLIETNSTSIEQDTHVEKDENENQLREKNIEAKLKQINISLKLKNIKEKEEK